MARYHCDKVSEQLQQLEGVRVTNMTRSSWTFRRGGAQINLRVLPGCCGILLVYQLSGPEKELVKLLTLVQKAAQRAEFGLVLITLRSDSRLRPLLGDVWASSKFNNPRTRNDVEVLTYLVPQKAKKQKPQVYGHEDA